MMIAQEIVVTKGDEITRFTNLLDEKVAIVFRGRAFVVDSINLDVLTGLATAKIRELVIAYN